MGTAGQVVSLGAAFAAATSVADPLQGSATENYAWAVIRMLNHLVPSDAIAWFSTNSQMTSAQMIGFPGELRDEEACETVLGLIDDHPMIVSYLKEPGRAGLPAPRRLSDLVTDRQLRKTRTYGALLRPVDRIRQLTVVSTGGQRFVSWTLNRRRLDFTDAELELLHRLQPTLHLLDRAYGEPPAETAAAPAPPPNQFGLTPRETQVLRQVRRGLTTRAVAHLLGISPKTVSKHLEHIYRKLGCDNRVTALERLAPTQVAQVLR